MSAFVVGTPHIDYLIDAALRYGRRDPIRYGERRAHAVTRETANAAGAMLLGANYLSVVHRYPDEPIVRPCDYAYRPRSARDVTPVGVLKAVDCYAYQACERDDWEHSEAWQFCEELRSAVIAALPGYEEAAWEITD